MAPSTKNLRKLLQNRSKNVRLEMFDGQGQLVLIITQFMIKMRPEDDEKIVFLKELDDLASVCSGSSRHSEEYRHFSQRFRSFMTEINVFFRVQNSLTHISRNELVAVFIDLFLEILEEILRLQSNFILRVKDSIQTLERELKFLITFLGDTPSQSTELRDTTKDVLPDIEAVANKVGSFLHTFFFISDRISVTDMNQNLLQLLENLKLVKDKIIAHCNTNTNTKIHRQREMASSTSNLKQLLQYQSKCQRLEMFSGQGQLVLIVTQFIIKLCSEDDEIIILLKRLEDSAKLCWIYSRHSEEDRKFSTMFWDFITQLKVFFEVPNFKSTADPNDVVAAFVDLLLEILEEILHRRPYFIHGSVEKFLVTVKMELKFLIIFLGDTPSQFTELETTKNVLKDIEVVANDVGSFLYSFFLSKDRISISAMNKSLSDLLENVKPVKVNIEKHCDTVADIWPNGMTPKTAVASLSFVDSILDYIEDLAHRNDGRIFHAKNQIRTIYQNLMDLKNGIKELDIEWHQDLEKFSMQLINVAYEVEYIINSFAPESYITRRLLQVTYKIKPLWMQFNELKKNDAGMLKDAEYPRRHISLPAQWPEIGDELFGLQDAEMELVDRLLRWAPQLQVISITGMPGLGKTTLAKRLYNNSVIVHHFERRSWCVVSRAYQRRNIFIDILMSIEPYDIEQFLNMEDEMLAGLLYRHLKNRRYIIVMDDVWKVNAWDDIKRFFPDGHNGSRILFTSQNMDVVMKGYYDGGNYPLRFLVEDESWNLLQWKVFNQKRCPPELVDVGKKIAINCFGLPITIVKIASVLKNLEKKRSLWMDVAENITSYISKETNEYMSVLEQSYNDLPMYLKPCFLYFGVFEKGREILVKKLIMLWRAEGFIGKVERMRAEDVAQKYLTDLINRSMLLVAKRRSDGGVKSCTIHGAMHDMCLRLAEKHDFVKVIKDRFSIYEQHRRLSIHSHSIPSFSRPFGLNIHSLLGYLPDPSAFMFSSLKHLKVLDLSTTDLSLYNLTGSEVLAFLRFLAVSSIPSSIEIFKNVEFLFVDNKDVVEIPAILLNMVKLRHVHFSGGAEFSESWRQATHDESFQISNLQNLSSIFIYDENDEKILRSFPQLCILKCKYTVFWDSSENCYRYPALNNLNQLESLNISFRPSYESHDISPELISLPSSLRKLTLCYFDFSWKLMEIIGELPNLEVLKLRDDTIQGKLWNTNVVFSGLKYLELDAVQIEHWNADDTHFPLLQRLVLRSCKLLKTLPSSFGEHFTLQKIEVHGCAESVGDSAMQIREEQKDYGKDEFEVIISVGDSAKQIMEEQKDIGNDEFKVIISSF